MANGSRPLKAASDIAAAPVLYQEALGISGVTRRPTRPIC